MDNDWAGIRTGHHSVQAGWPERRSGRGTLDERRIASAALDLIDRRGLRKLTMRQLGATLGVEAMALYRYVPSREDLLDRVTDLVLNDLFHDPSVQVSPPHWQDYLQRLAHGVREVALGHPEVFPLIATRPPEAPWLRPPLRSLRWMESFLDSLAACGFGEDQTAWVYRSFSGFLLGHLLVEVAAKGVDLVADDDSGDQGRDPDADLHSYPRLQRMRSKLSEDHSAEEFEDALEALVERVGRSL